MVDNFVDERAVSVSKDLGVPLNDQSRRPLLAFEVLDVVGMVDWTKCTSTA